MEATSTSALEAILDTSNSNDTNLNFQGAEEQQGEPWPAPEHEDDTRGTKQRPSKRW